MRSSTAVPWSVGPSSTCTAVASCWVRREGRPLVARLARACTAGACQAGYRLAPEHPFPAALDEALEAHRALSASGQPVVVAVDSAGGALALPPAMAIRDAGEEPSGAVATICPWLELTEEAAQLRGTAPREPLLTPGALARWAEVYADDAGDPLASPLHGDLDGLPPLILHSAGEEAMLVSDLAGKIALVTGGGRGVGAEIGALLAKAGAHVILDDCPDTEQAEATLGQILATAP
ncbi:alpha/beta hydrolase fold domain-containing protein [Streptomyces sp. NPDC050145]|uniref:alpha/beta hydrolase fold domain-containing protein n=1 Tax=Streptomyces sp. NPDC050145 TaxID=3365602 RepID=UPI00379C886D